MHANPHADKWLIDGKLNSYHMIDYYLFGEIDKNTHRDYSNIHGAHNTWHDLQQQQQQR